jgi:hypothetical protein
VEVVDGDVDVDVSLVVGRENSMDKGEVSETGSALGEKEMSETGCMLV